MKKEQKVLALSLAGIIILFIVGVFAYNSYQDSSMQKLAKEKESLFIRDYSMKVGSDDAKVKLVEFFDPACGTCAQFYPFVEDILKKNEGKIQLILRYAPFHNGVMDVVKILEASKKQDMYFEVLELLFQTQRYWTVNHQVRGDIALKIVAKLLLDMDQLQKDMNDPIVEERIQQDISDLEALNIKQTPSYFVNGKPLIKFGARELENLIDQELAK